MVFDRTQAGLVFAKPHLDLTNEVIRRYNAGEGREGGGARRQQAGGRQAGRRTRQEVGRTRPPMGMDIREIQAVLPHRYPFLFIDRVESIDDDRIVAQQAGQPERAPLRRPFPGQPGHAGRADHRGVGPGRARCWRPASPASIPTRQVMYFMGMDAVKFRRPVVPGDVLQLEVVPLRKRRRHLEVPGRGQGGRQVVAEAELLAGIRPLPLGPPAAPPSLRRLTMPAGGGRLACWRSLLVTAAPAAGLPALAAGALARGCLGGAAGAAGAGAARG